MKVLITGSRGMLGQDLVSVLEDTHVSTGYDIEELDICDLESCRAIVARLKPDWIVNAAAYTAVDDCEKNRDIAFRINAEGPGNLARAAGEIGARMVQVSTDYVFNGKQSSPYLETDSTDPESVYGASKLAGEINVQKALPDRSVIVRTAWLFGVNGHNFVETILKMAAQGRDLSIVDDQFGAPTFTWDLSQAIASLIDVNANGVVHVTNSGVTNWYEFARYFLAQTYPQTRVQPVTTAEFPRPAPRPAYSVLSTERLNVLTGNHLPHWQDGIDRYLKIKHSNKLKETNQ